jgi:hypothetical protein
MNTIFFYTYLLLVATSLILFTIARCIGKINTFDPLFYPNENNSILDNKLFLASHISVNFLLGLFFGFEVIYAMIIKIIAFESYLYFTEYCDVFKVAPFSTLIITYIISIISYVLGAVFFKSANKLIQ